MLSRSAAEPRADAREWTEQVVGGFRKMSVMQVVMAWTLYAEGHLSRRDLRVWFACHELEERRCTLRNDEPRKYSLSEIERLVGGVGGEHVRSSLRALERTGLLIPRRERLTFATSPDQLRIEDLNPLWQIFNAIPNNRRKLAVPRRLVRELAGGFSKAVMATVLGQFLTCVFWRRDEKRYRVDGRCKASWIAQTFGVTERSVAAARARLTALGWMEILPAKQWELNRWGGRVRINLDWRRGEHPPVGAYPHVDAANESGRGGKVGSDSSCPSAILATESSGPCLKQVPSPTSKQQNQKPAAPGPSRSGFLRRKGERKESPKLTDVLPGDLDDFGRLQELHRQAVERDLAMNGDGGLLDFVSLAERARVRGEDPCRLFVWLLKNQRFDFITLADEEAARERIKRELFGVEKRRKRDDEDDRPRCKGPVARIELSEDARLVAGVRAVAQKHRLTGDPFYLLRRERPDWTRERWDKAQAELENARLLRFQAMHTS